MPEAEHLATRRTGNLCAGFTGHRWDAETGMYFAPFRYYAPQNARWMKRDPAGFVDGVNVYAYVKNRPTYTVDPMGRQAITLTGACLAGLTALAGALGIEVTWHPIGNTLAAADDLVRDIIDSLTDVLSNWRDDLHETVGTPDIPDWIIPEDPGGSACGDALRDAIKNPSVSNIAMAIVVCAATVAAMVKDLLC